MGKQPSDYVLRVRAGSSYDPATHVSVNVNDEQNPVLIDSEHFTGNAEWSRDLIIVGRTNNRRQATLLFAWPIILVLHRMAQPSPSITHPLTTSMAETDAIASWFKDVSKRTGAETTFCLAWTLTPKYAHLLGSRSVRTDSSCQL